MNNFRNVNDDILKDWLDFRDQKVFCELSKQDKEHNICFDEFCERILRNVPDMNKKYVQKQLDLLYDNIFDHVDYCTEKYYRNGFCDGIQLVGGGMDK